MRNFLWGSKEVDPPLILAPMAGISEILLRRTFYKRGWVGFVITEMVPVEGLIRKVIKLDEIGEEDYDYTAIQLSGSEPLRFVEAAKIVEGRGGKYVDINMGCPVKKIVKSGGGASLLKEPKKVEKIIDGIVKNTRLTVSAKIRSGFDEKNINFKEIGKIIEECGAKAITLHPRTREDHFTKKARWEHIGELKSLLKIPVIGNGDIRSSYDAKKMFEETHCDGVMIGRAMLENPFIFEETINLYKNNLFSERTEKELLDFWIEYFENLLSKNSKRIVHHMKVISSKATKGIKNGNSFRKYLSSIKDPSKILEKLKELKAYLN